jgi:hypothetical protein
MQLCQGFFLITAIWGGGADYTAGLYHIEWNNGYNYAIEASLSCLQSMLHMALLRGVPFHSPVTTLHRCLGVTLKIQNYFSTDFFNTKLYFSFNNIQYVDGFLFMNIRQ